MKQVRTVLAQNEDKDARRYDQYRVIGVGGEWQMRQGFFAHAATKNYQVRVYLVRDRGALGAWGD